MVAKLKTAITAPEIETQFLIDDGNFIVNSFNIYQDMRNNSINSNYCKLMEKQRVDNENDLNNSGKQENVTKEFNYFHSSRRDFRFRCNFL